MAFLSQITVPVSNGGEIVNTTFDLKDQGARELIEALGNALYWMGVTTTALTDGATTNPIQINGEDVTAKIGGMASYDGLEFVWNGSAWQAMGHANFGALAFKSSASADYQPAGTVAAPAISVTGNTSATVNSITDVGTLPTFTVSGETLTFTPGTLPTKGADQTVVSDMGTITASAPAFIGSQTTITVE